MSTITAVRERLEVQGVTTNAEEAFEIAIEAYHYLYPLILMDITRQVMNNRIYPGSRFLGQTNLFQHNRTYPPAEYREVVRPNFDTLYSTTWLDLTKEPQIISVPDTAGRYYLLPLIDMWTDVFAVPGKRTSGTSAAHFAVTPPGWSGSLPDGVEQIEASTPIVWIIGRTQTNGAADYEAVGVLQDQLSVTPLSSWGRAFDFAQSGADAEPDPSIDMKTPPMIQVNSMSPEAYFSYGAELMELHPPHSSDWSIVKRMQGIGLRPGMPFRLAELSDEVSTSVGDGIVEALNRMKLRAAKSSGANNWQILTENIGVYGNSYLQRAAIAMYGLGANQPEDAIYPSCSKDMDGQPLVGEKKYVIHFDAGKEPPANAFWSLTAYDVEGFPIPNSINRCALGDRDALTYNEDGSLDIIFQGTSPGTERESNWLPTTAEGPWNVVMRLYHPKSDIIVGKWNPPPITRLD